jgi:hypothetical protein
MIERRRRMGDNALEAINSLALEIARLTRIREEEQSGVLADHGRILGQLTTDMAVLVERTSELGTMNRRIVMLELWKSRWMGVAAASLGVGGVLGWAIQVVLRR